MSRKYYYFAASLPYLDFDSDLSMSLDDFLIQAEQHLEPHHFSCIEGIVHDKPIDADSQLYHDWQAFEHQLRNTLAQARAKDSNTDPFQHVRGSLNPNGLMLDLTKNAMAEEDPLVVTKMLDKARWMVVDHLSATRFFDYDFIVAYAIKLRILHRYALVATDEGREKFNLFKDNDLVGQVLAEERI